MPGRGLMGGGGHLGTWNSKGPRAVHPEVPRPAFPLSPRLLSVSRTAVEFYRVK